MSRARHEPQALPLAAEAPRPLPGKAWVGGLGGEEGKEAEEGMEGYKEKEAEEEDVVEEVCVAVATAEKKEEEEEGSRREGRRYALKELGLRGKALVCGLRGLVFLVLEREAWEMGVRQG